MSALSDLRSEALAQRLATGSKADNTEQLEQVLSRDDAAVIARALELAQSGNRQAGDGMRLTIEISGADADLVAEFVQGNGQQVESSHGPLTIETLAAMLLEDVALAVRRPGSWEGANMGTVLASHGYGS
jgi:plasmid replication initiation protein